MRVLAHGGAIRLRERTRFGRRALSLAVAAILCATLADCGRKKQTGPAGKAAAQSQEEAQLLARVAKDPNDLESRLALGNLYFDTGRPHMAIPEYRAVLKQHPDDPDVRTDLGTCYRDLDAFYQARAEYERVLRDHPKHVQATYNLAVVSEILGDPARAADLWEAVASWMPGSATGEAARKNALEARSKLQPASIPEAPPQPAKEPQP